MLYLIGDLQGCCDAFERLVSEIGFSPSRDRLVVLGDLVNRGPASLATLKRLRDLGDAATCLLGNHDLHLLAVACGGRRAHRSDTLDEVLASPEREAWLEWLRARRMAVVEGGWLFVHAGVPPQWTAVQTLARAAEVGARLRRPDYRAFLEHMYGNKPHRWDDALDGDDRLRFIVNALTRLRIVEADGRMRLKFKESASAAPEGTWPWFEHPQRATRDTPIVFGHWANEGLVRRSNVTGIDTGCVWGGRLTALRLDDGALFHVDCPQALAPGD